MRKEEIEILSVNISQKFWDDIIRTEKSLKCPTEASVRLKGRLHATVYPHLSLVPIPGLSLEKVSI